MVGLEGLADRGRHCVSGSLALDVVRKEAFATMSEKVEIGHDGYLRQRSVFQQADNTAKASAHSEKYAEDFGQLDGSYQYTTFLVQDHRVRYADARLSRLAGGQAGALVGTPVVRHLQAGSGANDTDDAADYTQENSPPSRCLGTIRYRNGQKRSVTLTGKHVDHEGREAELFVITDISEETEQQASAAPDMQEVGRIAKGIAHDLNNVLQNILGPAELLMSEEPQSEEAATCLSEIIRACKHGGGLVDRLLTFTRQDEPVLKTLHLQNIVNTVRHNLSHSMPDDFSITTDIPDDLWPITASGKHMARVLVELSVNAYEAEGSRGAVNISARNVRITDDDHPEAPRVGAFLLITVSDEAGGMDDETQDLAFEPFFTTKERSEHSGLGLPLIRDIVAMHYGSIHCDSSPGVGTTVRIYLPAHPDTEEPAEGAEEAEKPRGSILIVDDDPNICWATQILLERCGHKVSTVSNGREALELYSEQGDSIDLIILDLVMPEMDGETCLNHLMEMDPDVQVIIASGSLSDKDKRRRLAEKARDYVSKPFDSTALLQAVNEALEGIT